MNKEQSADDPAVDLIRIILAPFAHHDFPDVCNCMYRT